jgi:hypothetical protein
VPVIALVMDGMRNTESSVIGSELSTACRPKAPSETTPAIIGSDCDDAWNETPFYRLLQGFIDNHFQIASPKLGAALSARQSNLFVASVCPE